MEFEDSFEIPAAPAEVMQRFADVERISKCVPGLTIIGRDEDGGYLGVMTVAFGPKRLKFQGKVQCEFDMEQNRGVLTGGGAASARGAGIQVRTTFSVVSASDATAEAPKSIVDIQSYADLQGVLAQFAGTGGVALGRQLMRDFAYNLTKELSNNPTSASQEPIEEAKLVPSPSAALSEPSLSIVHLLRTLVVEKIKGLWRVFAR